MLAAGGVGGRLRARLYGHALDEEQYLRLLRDAVAGRLSHIELAAFVAAEVGEHVDLAETIALTRAMVRVGDRLHRAHPRVIDKHCVGDRAPAALARGDAPAAIRSGAPWRSEAVLTPIKRPALRRFYAGCTAANGRLRIRRCASSSSARPAP
ncbi:MAG: hypothetical protein DI564_15830 [Rhodanobacter denitrificans]|uniref:Thymidine phosphorylase n=1 Tax=Rhodanobacter denitrificans TaxID=666685 RepID=A0A2W5K3A1_9GAMM|nr:MAG: hypothetical protein DI564_15830 [Rhodanobacter denitrificans]